MQIFLLEFKKAKHLPRKLLTYREQFSYNLVTVSRINIT